MLKFAHINSDKTFVNILSMQVRCKGCKMTCIRKMTSEPLMFSFTKTVLPLTSSVLPTPEEPQNKKTRGWSSSCQPFCLRLIALATAWIGPSCPTILLFKASSIGCFRRYSFSLCFCALCTFSSYAALSTGYDFSFANFACE